MNRTIRLAAALGLALTVQACSEPIPAEPEAAPLPPASMPAEPPRTAVEALAPFYAQLEYDKPIAAAGPALPAPRTTLRSIAFGSCNTQEWEIPILRTIAAEDHDIFMYIGDNVYGDVYSDDATMPELRWVPRIESGISSPCHFSSNGL